MSVRRLALALTLLAIAAGTPGAPALAQSTETERGETPRVDAYGEALRKQDPAAYERYVALRTERDTELARLKALQERIKTATVDEKMPLYEQFRATRQRYAEAYVRFLDFLDERDGKTIQRYEDAIRQQQEAIEKLRAVIERRKAARAELEKALVGE